MRLHWRVSMVRLEEGYMDGGVGHVEGGVGVDLMLDQLLERPNEVS